MAAPAITAKLSFREPAIQIVPGSNATYPAGSQPLTCTSRSFPRTALIADGYSSTVVKETLSGGVFTQSVLPSSTLSAPFGVAVDEAGNIYIADSGKNRILKETPSGTGYTESVIATTALSHPYAVAVDGSGNVYIADA